MSGGRGDGSYEHLMERVPYRDTLVMVRKQRRVGALRRSFGDLQEGIVRQAKLL